MSGGVNVKSAPRGSLPSGIPLPRSLLLSSPKVDPRHRTRIGHQALTQTPRTTPTHSVSLFPKNSSSPAPLPSHSSYCGPLNQCQAPAPSEQDIAALPKMVKQPSIDGNHNRNTFTNQNHKWSPQTHRSREDPAREGGPAENHPDYSELSNYTNLRPSLSPLNCKNVKKGRVSSTSQSDEEMGGTSDDSSPIYSPRPPLLPTPITFKLPEILKMYGTQNPEQGVESVETHPPKVNMATVAPFSYRLQDNFNIFSVDELSDCSSGSIEVCCDDLIPGGMLEAIVDNISMTAKPTELKTRTTTTTAAAAATAAHAAPCPDSSDLHTMASRKPTPKPSALPQGPSRPSSSTSSSGSELTVYRSSSGSIPVPVPNPSGLRKQRSLTNLSVLTDAEKKLHLYQSSRLNDSTGKSGTGADKPGQTKTCQGGKTTLSRTLSKSEQSLFQGRSKPVGSTAGKLSRIPGPGKPRGPYAEVKPISKTCQVEQKADREPEDHPIKTNSHGTGNLGKKPGEKVRSASLSTEEKKEMQTEEDKNFLKVDPELVVTVLGDLEQLLFSQILDPESQRKRTVQNVLDLRQNLEETMTSLRGAQLSHSCVEGSTCYDSDEAAAFSISTLSNRSSPLSWRQGQASPRLQAGDAPSSGNTQTDVPQRSRHIMSRIHLVEDLEDADTSLLKGGYMSDSDAGGRSPNEGDDDDDDDDEDLGNGWDESSSISSGLSDGSDNLSCEDFNSSTALNSLPSTPVSSRRSSNILMRTDAEKRSLVENGLCWDTEDSKPNCKNQGSNIYDTGSPKSESANRWKKTRPQGDGLDGVGRGELKKPQTLGQGNVLKKGRNQPVGVTSPITHTSQSGLKVAGSIKSDMKPMDKSRLAVKSSGLQRSSSDAGKDHRNGTSAVEQRKPPSGLVRPSAGGNFGFKKPNTAQNGANINGTGTGTGALSSSTVGKTPKTSGIPVKPAAGGSGGRKISLDVSSCDQSGFLSPSARTSLQYRSLPRPAKTSTLTLTRPSSARPVSTTVDTNSGLTKPSSTTAALQGSRLKEPVSVLSSGPGLSKAGSRGIPSPGPVNQTDREKEKERAKAKAVMSDSECGGGSLKGGSAHSISEKLQGLRPPSGGKSLDRSATNIQRLSGVRSLGKPQSVAQMDKLNSNSLDLEVQASLPPKIPPYSKLQDLSSTVSSSSSSSSGSHLTPSPAPLLTVSSSACFSTSVSGLGSRQVSSLETNRGSSSPLLYPRLSGLHRSMESLPLQMSLAPEHWEKNREVGHGSVDSRTKERQEDTQRCPVIGTRVSLTLPDTSDVDRNTLPKKGLSFISSSQAEELSKERGERRHSHTVFSVNETLALPLLSSPTSLSRSSRTGTAASSPVSSAPRMTRSNSIPAHEGSVEAYAESPLGSTLSLSERPRSIGMIRSGSFRDRDSDEVHGSVLSLASNASSTYSSQIRKLRRELESSQEKVSALTTQLSTNANLVAAFEQSLALMTTRLQSLSMSHEQKDNELLELRETIDAMKVRNEEAQAVIHGALNNQENTKDLQMRRQNSCESISSLNSLTSMSSIGSLKDQDAKKKKKKSWLRSSFNKAFSIKKGSKTYSDIEEIATPDSSAPNSPKMLHEGGEGEDIQAPPLNHFAIASSSAIMESTETEEGDGEDTSVSDLRSELWVKERELTDIRLEALNSAHQLEQLRDAMNNMQSMVENLKAENCHLKTGTQLNSQGPGPASSTSQPSGLASLVGPSLKQPISMSLTKSFSLSLNDTKDLDPCHVNIQSVSSSQEDVCARVLVHSERAEVTKGQQEFCLGTVLVNTKTDWASLDSLILKTFKDYLTQVDPTASLGLSSESVLSYQLTHGGRQLIGGEDKPQLQPLRCLGGSSASIYVTLKGLKENCVDSLVFETLIPKPMMQHYISLLLKHRRLVLSGSSGTGKSFLAQRLALYLLQRSSSESEQEAGFHGRSAAVTFNMHHQTQKELQLYLTNVANHIDQDNGGELPLVVIVDDINDPAGVTEMVNAALTCKYHKSPYIIGTTNQPVKMTSNNGLHMSFRMVTFSNNVEPANGFLLRYLHRKAVEAHQDRGQDSSHLQALLCVLDWVPQLWYHLHTFLEKHSTSDFLIGPCFFLSCPVTMKEFRHWFIDLWNNSIIPYLQEGAKDGMKVHGQRAVWEDPVEWVRGTLPWPNAQQDQSRLFHLPPPSITASCGEEKKLAKDTPPASSLDSDPLMAMLLKLQESANYIESPEQEGVDPSLQTTL